MSCLDTIQDLESRGVLSATVAEAERLRCSLPAEAGWFDFVSLVWIVVGVLLLVSLSWLFVLYVVPWLKRLPKWVHEIVAHASCGALMFGPMQILDGGGAVAFSFAGCLAWVGALAYTHDRRFSSMKGEQAFRIYAAILCVVWSLVAVLAGSVAIGFLAAIAYGWFAGAIIVPVYDLVEFVERDRVPLAMLAAALLVATFGAYDFAYAELFRPGAFVVGGAVWFGGCLVLASKHYRFREKRYLVTQVLAVASGFGALFLGTVLGFDGLLEAGGSFLAIYGLEKFFEIRWKEHGYAWMCLALAGVLYGGALILERYPQYFLGL